MQTASEAGILEHEPGDLTCIVEGGIRLSALRRSARRARAAALARPAGRPDARGMPARRSVRPARASLRHDARPRDRRDGRASRRDARELGRQGREERRGLRPREALLRLARASRVGRAARAAPAPAAGCRAHGRARSRLAGAAPLAARRRARSTSPTDACTCSSRAPRRAVDAQLRALGGEEAEPWEELRALQARLPGRVRWDGQAAQLVRPGPGSPTSKRCASRSGARSPNASWSRCAARADRRLRPLRLLPADLPDVFALERGDGLAARADLPDAGARRRIDRADRHGRRALRPLPRLHGLRDLVPVRRAVRPADRADARLRRGSPPPHAARASRARRRSSRSFRTGGGCAPRSSSASCRLPGRSRR